MNVRKPGKKEEGNANYKLIILMTGSIKNIGPTYLLTYFKTINHVDLKGVYH